MNPLDILGDRMLMLKLNALWSSDAETLSNKLLDEMEKLSNEAKCIPRLDSENRATLERTGFTEELGKEIDKLEIRFEKFKRDMAAFIVEANRKIDELESK